MIGLQIQLQVCFLNLTTITRNRKIRLHNNEATILNIVFTVGNNNNFEGTTME